jgi:hypothetical protein
MPRGDDGGRSGPPFDGDEPADCRAGDEFWIGVRCEPPGALVRAQLRIASGLAVTAVHPGSPAARAGLLPHDILTSINGSPLVDCGQLCDLVQDTGRSPAQIEVIRGGIATQLVVTPEPRPDSECVSVTIVLDRQHNLREADLERVREMLSAEESGDSAPQRIRLFVVGPAEQVEELPLAPLNDLPAVDVNVDQAERAANWEAQPAPAEYVFHKVRVLGNRILLLPQALDEVTDQSDHRQGITGLGRNELLAIHRYVSYELAAVERLIEHWRLAQDVDVATLAAPRGETAVPDSHPGEIAAPHGRPIPINSWPSKIERWTAVANSLRDYRTYVESLLADSNR